MIYENALAIQREKVLLAQKQLQTWQEAEILVETFNTLKPQNFVIIVSYNKKLYILSSILGYVDQIVLVPLDLEWIKDPINGKMIPQHINGIKTIDVTSGLLSAISYWVYNDAFHHIFKYKEIAEDVFKMIVPDIHDQLAAIEQIKLELESEDTSETEPEIDELNQQDIQDLITVSYFRL